MQSRIELVMAASDAFDARGGGVDEEKRELRERSEKLSAIMMHVDTLIESIHGLTKQQQLFLAVDYLARAALSLGAIMKNSPFIEDAQTRQRAARARGGVSARKARQQALLLPLIRDALEANLTRKALLDDANALLADRGEGEISRTTLDAWVKELSWD